MHLRVACPVSRGAIITAHHTPHLAPSTQHLANLVSHVHTNVAPDTGARGGYVRTLDWDARARLTPWNLECPLGRMQHAGHTDPTRERRHGCRCRSRCRRRCRCRSSSHEATRLAFMFMWPDTHLGHTNVQPRATKDEGRHTTHDRSGRARRAAIAISVSFPGPRAGSCARARNKLGTRIHEAYRISEPQNFSSSSLDRRHASYHIAASWGGVDGAGLASVPPTCVVAERHRTRGGASLETRCAKLVFAQVCTVASVERT